jgi:hypothetical protein
VYILSGAYSTRQSAVNFGISRLYEWRKSDGKSAVPLLGQAISIERKALKIRYFEDLSNGFTPRLHLLKVNYPMNDKSALRDVECFFEYLFE